MGRHTRTARTCRNGRAAPACMREIGTAGFWGEAGDADCFFGMHMRNSAARWPAGASAWRALSVRDFISDMMPPMY